MNEIIITGATGFVGENLSQYFLQNNKNPTPVSLRNSNWTTLINRDSDAIIHLAGKAHDTQNTTEASDYFKINTEITKTLFDLFLESNISVFVYFSSVKACADDVVGVLTEEDLPNPKTPYGISKLQAEQYILSKELPKSKKVFIIRPCMIHGKGNKGNLNLLFNIVKIGIPYPLAKFKNERSFLSIDNLNYLVNKILENTNISSGIYNFADDSFVSTNDLVKIISGVLHKKPRLLIVPKSVINFFSSIGDKINLPLNSESVKKMTENYRVSNQKIKLALGIDALPFNIQGGLKKTITSFIDGNQ